MKTGAFWQLLAAHSISVLGDAFGMLALEWLVYDLTGSMVAMGTIAMAIGLPEFLVRLFAAPLLDRVHRVRLMALLDGVRFLAFGLPALLSALGLLHLWHLYVAAVVLGTCSALFNPSSMALLPSLVRGEELVRCNSLLDSAMTGAMLLGPVLAGLLIKTAGPVPSMVLDAGSYAVSALLLTRIARTGAGAPKPKPADATGKSSYWKEAMEGAAFFRKVPALFVIMCFVAVSNMCSVAVGAMWVPYVQDVLHADAFALGVLSTVSGAGFLAGALLIAKLGDVKKRRLAMLGSIIGKGAVTVALGSVSHFWAAVPLFALYGIAGPFFGSFSSALFGRLVPEELRGRVMSIRLLIGGSLQPVGSGMSGVFASSFGIPALLLAAGLFPAVCALCGFLLPALRGIDGDLSAARPAPSHEKSAVGL